MTSYVGNVVQGNLFVHSFKHGFEGFAGSGLVDFWTCRLLVTIKLPTKNPESDRLFSIVA